MAVVGPARVEGSDPLFEPEPEDLLEGADEVFGLTRGQETRRRPTTDPVRGLSSRVAYDQGNPPAEAAEGYAELLSEQIHGGHLPRRAQVRASLAGIWPMVSASYVPLLALLVARALGATTKNAAMVALVVTVVLAVAHGWAAGRAAKLPGPRLLLVTLIAGAFGVVLILLKLLVTH